MDEDEEYLESDNSPKCPNCGHVNAEAEDWRPVVNYWGTESGPVEFSCSGCDADFMVDEVVTRVWRSTPMIQHKAR